MNAKNGGDAVEGAAEPRKAREQHKSITMADIAKTAGVSQGAISSLLNDRDYGIRVSERTRDRVFKACRELGYVPNDLRAFVRMYPERGEVAVLIANTFPGGLGDPFVARLISSVMNALDDPSHPVTLAEYDPAVDYDANFESLPHSVRWGVASKFICLGGANLSLLNAIHRRGFRAVSVGPEAALAGVTSIVFDDAEATRMGVEYLFKMGHNRIAVLSGPFGAVDPRIVEFNRGIRLAYDAARIPIEAQNVIYGDMTFQNGFHSAELLLNRQPPFTAVLCFSEKAAAGVLARLQSEAVKVPGRISVLACGDDALSECVHPALTTVRVPAEEIGATAVAEIERLAAEKDEASLEIKKIVLAPQLDERDSCAAPERKTKSSPRARARS